MSVDNNTEKTILESAVALFLEQGYAKTTTAQIANRAGCNQALVHYYFRTKDKLFDKIFEEKARLLLNNFFKKDGKGETFQEKLIYRIKSHFDFIMQNPKLPAFLYNEISTNPDRIKSVVSKLENMPKELFNQMDKELKEEIKKGTIRPISVIDLLFMIISLNLTPFLLLPITQTVLEINNKQVEQLMKKKKKKMFRSF